MLHFPIELESTVDTNKRERIFNTKQVISIDFRSIVFILLCKISIPPAIQLEMKRSHFLKNGRNFTPLIWKRRFSFIIKLISKGI